MKLSESNPLRQELARSQQVESHPDSDVLTALSEGGLLQRERQRILAHLAACADCREILSIAAATAIDPADDLKPFLVRRPSRPPRRAWLPWASLAACLLVACSAVLFYQQKLALPRNATVATREPVRIPLSTAQSPARSPSAERKETLGKTENSAALKSPQTPHLFQNLTAANAILQAPIESAKQSEVSRQSSYQAGAEVGEMATPATPVLKAAPAQSVPAFVNATTERERSAASITAAARPHWRINGMGQPERSYGDGVWQTVLSHEPSKMRVISVFDGEVWIGGDHSRLYHSIDNGMTWNLIALPDKNGRKHSIAHIHFQTSQSGTVESDDGAVWTTSDGGSTWQ